MPINRNALIRYRTIDRCLQNRRRKWTIENLMDACSSSLYEIDGVDKPISMRTIRLDLNMMRGGKLGYAAPIIVKGKKYYSYEDPGFSISNIPLNSNDLDVLNEVTHLLQQYKGFSHFREVAEIISKLEDKIYSEKNQQVSLIDFEKNDLLAGIEWLDVLYKATVSKTAIQLSYQSFRARAATEVTVYPYLLKEYRNRWFVAASKRKEKQVNIFALDRIQNVALLPGEPFYKNPDFDPNTWFANIIGVTRNKADSPTEIRFLANPLNAPYIQTKPLHASQQLIEKTDAGIIFSIYVIPNFELEKELLGFGDGIRILFPAFMVKRIGKKIKKMAEMYS
jgi:predicted DNA-binding transcriptional regulator YafY